MKKILVIDDDMIVHDVLDQVLGEKYELIHANNAKNGLKQFAKKLPDVALVLLDMEMPKKSGLETLEEMEIGNLAEIPVVMLTSVDDQEVKEKCVLAGALDYITKPIHVADLTDRIAAYIGK